MYALRRIDPKPHEMSLNLKTWQVEILHVSNLQVPLVILILKSCFFSEQCGCDVFLKVACVAEAILRKSALQFSLGIERFFFSNRRLNCNNLYQFWHRITLNIGAPEET